MSRGPLREFAARFWKGTLLLPPDPIPQAPPPPPPLPAAGLIARTAEQFVDPDLRQNLEGGFRQLSGGDTSLRQPFIRDLPPAHQDYMLRVVQKLWERNLLAKWLVEIVVDFVLGEQCSVSSDDPRVQAVIDSFWGDPVNQLETRLDGFIREYGMYGELILPVAVNEIDGHVRLGYIDPLDVQEVLTEPGNVLVAREVVVKGGASGRPPRVFKVIREETARYSRAFGYLMPAADGEICLYNGRPYDGSTFLFQVNKLSNGRRGRSDLLPAIDWVDQYDNFLFDSMDLANLLNTFVWDAKLEGFTEERIREWLAKFGSNLKRGEVFAHNEKVTLTAQAPTLQALDKDTFARLHRGYILGAFGYPEHWFGLGGSVNFASAKEMALPPIKRLSRRQKEVRTLIETMVRFAIDQAVVHGELPPEVHEQTEPEQQGAVTITLPDLMALAQPGATVNDTRQAAGQAPVKEGDMSPFLFLQKRGRRLREGATRADVAREAYEESFKKTRPANEAFQVNLPELSQRDQSATVASLTSLVASLIQAQRQGWLQPLTAAKLFANMVSLLGMPVDAAEEFTPGGVASLFAEYGGGGGDEREQLQQLTARLTAQLSRQGNGNGDNVNERKKTTPRGGQVSEAYDEAKHPRDAEGQWRGAVGSATKVYAPVKPRKVIHGVAHYASRDDAHLAAVVHGWPTDRIYQTEHGWVVRHSGTGDYMREAHVEEDAAFEAEHPRDAEGRFTEKPVAAMETHELKREVATYHARLVDFYNRIAAAKMPMTPEAEAHAAALGAESRAFADAQRPRQEAIAAEVKRREAIPAPMGALLHPDSVPLTDDAPGYVKDAYRHLDALDPEVRRAVEARHVRVLITTRSAGDVMGDRDTGSAQRATRHTRPTGWHGKGWAKVPGVYMTPEKLVVAGDKGGHGGVSLLLHELGHAVHHVVLDAADMTTLRGVWAKEVARNARVWPYFKQRKISSSASPIPVPQGVKETFAESVAFYTLGGRARVMQEFGPRWADAFEAAWQKTKAAGRGI